jgi:hypothetical protein
MVVVVAVVVVAAVGGTDGGIASVPVVVGEEVEDGAATEPPQAAIRTARARAGMRGREHLGADRTITSGSFSTRGQGSHSGIHPCRRSCASRDRRHPLSPTTGRTSPPRLPFPTCPRLRRRTVPDERRGPGDDR